MSNTKKYVAGWNVPGFMPEMEPQVFDSAKEAVDFLSENVELFWDQDYDASYGLDTVENQTKAKLYSDEKWLPVHTDLHNGASTSEALDSYTSDQSLVFWFHQVED